MYKLIEYILRPPAARPQAEAEGQAEAQGEGQAEAASAAEPFRWNVAPQRIYPLVVASGGLPGTFDPSAPLVGKSPMHGHHVWPKYVGGPRIPAAQLSVHHDLHRTAIHDPLHLVLAAAAAPMGFPVLRRNARNRDLSAI